MLIVPKAFPARRLRCGPVRAAAESLAAVLLLIVGQGLVFFPLEVERWLHEQVAISACCTVAGDEQQIVALFKVAGKHSLGRVQPHLALHNRNSTWTEFDHDWDRSTLTCLAAPAQGGSLYAGDAGGAIHVFDPRLPSSGPLRIGQQAEYVTGLVTSRDGRTVVSMGMDSVYVWDCSARRLTWRRDDMQVKCLAIHPAGRRLICGTRLGELLEIDLASGQTLRNLIRIDGQFCATDLSADGELIAALGDCGTIFVLEADSAQPIWPAARRTAGHASAVKFSPCGRLLVSGSHDDLISLAVWSVATGRLEAELRGHTAAVVGLSFVRTGTLQSWSTDGTIRAWDLSSLSASPERSLASTVPTREVSLPRSFSPLFSLTRRSAGLTTETN